MLVNKKHKTVINFNVCKCNLLSSMLGLCENKLWRGIYLKFEIFLGSINYYFPELILIFI